MKPVGLTNPHDPQVKAYAIVQLRQDNKLGTLFNMVGFQTKLKHGEQTRIFRTIPGLERAEFARLGGLHRNTFLNSPKLARRDAAPEQRPRLRFAGQITGCEGYVEIGRASASMAGRFAAAETARRTVVAAAHDHGAWRAARLHHRRPHRDHRRQGRARIQPMNVNFGLFPPLAQVPTKDADGTRLRGPAEVRRREARAGARALADLDQWIGGARRRGIIRTRLRRIGCAARHRRPLPPPLRQLRRRERLRSFAAPCGRARAAPKPPAAAPAELPPECCFSTCAHAGRDAAARAAATRPAPREARLVALPARISLSCAM